MLYKKSQSKELDMNLFQTPTAEYRGAPFWAWNCKLDREQMLRQIDHFKAMGFGGFHIHSRTGMASEYLGAEFMEHIKACAQKAKAEGLLCWLYDEDRYPSGVAGGRVTKEKKYRCKYLSFSRTAPAACLGKEEAFDAGKPYFLAAYDVVIDGEGMLKSYARIASDAEAKGEKWYASVLTAEGEPRYNGEAYIDIMDEEAVSRFIDLTYGAYARAVGEEFDRTVPAIFTDEPTISCRKPEHTIPTAHSTGTILYTWTRYMEEKYQERYGEDLLDRLPELFWKKADGGDSLIKYRYYDFCADLFYTAFTAQCGDWCEKHGIAFTGHIFEEPTLSGQAESVGDLLRQYKAFTLPGIDMLCNRTELTTAKQAQSVVRQLGKEGMMSELYGVTNWDFDFRGHKFQGDWQAAMGVTVRVPHLAWMSMAGEAKRDYPASLFYQSPWYKEYAYIEDHFARLNTVLTRGTPVVKVGVIHPVESDWILTGPADQTADARKALDQNHQTLNRWLLEGHQDFDYISEGLLAQIADEKAPRKVGVMEYETIVVPGCLTLRKTTAQYLARFAKAGGKVILMGDAPAYTDGVLSKEAEKLLKCAASIPFDKTALLQALEPCRRVELRHLGGGAADHMTYQLRQDGEDQWLFIARFKPERMGGIDAQMGTEKPRGEKIEILIEGEHLPQIYDTMSGKILPVTFRHVDGKTVVIHEFFPSDSLLLRLSAPIYGEFILRPEAPAVLCRRDWKEAVAFIREEANVLVLDMAEYRLDQEPWQEKEEVLLLDNALRKALGWPLRTAKIVQPWAIPAKAAEHTASLRFTVESEVKVKAAKLALENAAAAKILWNGKPVRGEILGYYVDESIQTVALPGIKKGKNILEITLPFGKREHLENCFILGDFDVSVRGAAAKITAPRKEIAFGSVTHQGMPFYGGNLTYELPFEAVADGDLTLHCGKYVGALLKIALDDGEGRPLAFAPYNVTFKKVQKGKHTLKVTLFGNRVNTFGCLHNCADLFNWYGPGAWRTQGDHWSYEYQLKDFGLLISPKLELHK